MAKENGRGGKERHEGTVGIVDTGGKQCVERLRRIFVEFRQGHRRRTRIPQALREAALGALESGIPELQVRRACRISTTQLGWWRQRQRACEQGFQLDEDKPGIFPVVDEQSDMAVERESEETARSVHLRVGRWDIRIQQVER